MSPSKTQETAKGSRPSPIRISRDSHSIHKQPDHPGNGAVVAKNPTKRAAPVIIYTHSPKVIHAQAHDFMSLVQKLTGFTPSHDAKEGKREPEAGENGSSSSSEEKDLEPCGSMDGELIQHDSSAVFAMHNPYLQCGYDVPFFSSEALFNSSSMFQSSTMASSVSPSFMDFMKGFPEYS